MAIYDLNHAYYLWEDIGETLNTSGLLYSIEQNEGKRFIKSNTKVSGEFHFTSEECQTAFNKLIPKVKSLHKDMYSLIEAITKHKNNNQFHTRQLANKYDNFNEFRQLNNKFKHFTTQEVEIGLTSLVMMEGDYNVIDVYCNFKKKDGSLIPIRYPEFIETFLRFLKDYELISFKY